MSKKEILEKENETGGRLKPVIFSHGLYNYHQNSYYKQNLLLKAMQTTSNLDKMKELTGIKTTAEIYRTLDKLSIRKEYHAALTRQGIDLDTIVGGIKDLCINSKSDNVKLRGWKTLLKSLGVDEYKEDNVGQGKSWEEMMKDFSQRENDTENTIKQVDDYEVITPKVPKDEQAKRDEEKKDGVSLYDE